MRPNSLRLALLERVDEGKVTGQPTQQDTDPPPERENPEPSGTEETSGTPMPNKPTTEEADKTPTLGEHIPIYFLMHMFIARPGPLAHHEEESGPPPEKSIDLADPNHHRHDPGDPPNAGGHRH